MIPSEQKRVIAIGDVHGCLEELRELLALVSYNASHDHLVFLGDLVDRGPDPIGVVRYVRELNAECVKGNHDEKIPRWRRHKANEQLTGKPNPMRRPDEKRLAEWEGMSEDDVRWLDALPCIVSLAPGRTGWVGVHAGFEPARSLSEQRDDRMCRIRYVDANGEFAASKYAGHVPDGAIPWMCWSGEWKSPARVVYGHAVHDLAAPRVDRVGEHGFCYGIDTGCCFGGKLTAWIKPVTGTDDAIEIISVAAKATYADLKFANVE